MTRDDIALARILLHGKILRADGQAFESLFTQVMSYAHADFKQIKPQGPVGDKKNDGYHTSTGSYYQVFAPEQLEAGVKRAVTKLEDDFAGLKKYWDSICPITEFRFVLNDKYKGSFPEIENGLAKIKKKHKLHVCESFLARHLEDAVFALPDDQIVAVVGFIPSPQALRNVQYSVLTEVLEHLMNLPAPNVPPPLLVAPAFEAKLQFNGLSEGTANILTTASYQSGHIDRYFANNSGQAKQLVRDKVAAIYTQLDAQTFPAAPNGASRADQVLFGLVDEVSGAQSKAAWDAAMVVVAYYFEACDVFEAPVP